MKNLAAFTVALVVVLGAVNNVCAVSLSLRAEQRVLGDNDKGQEENKVAGEGERPTVVQYLAKDAFDDADRESFASMVQTVQQDLDKIIIAKDTADPLAAASLRLTKEKFESELKQMSSNVKSEENEKPASSEKKSPELQEKEKKQKADATEKKMKAGKEILTGLRKVVKGFKDGKPADALGALFDTGTAVAFLFPGAQGFGLFFAFTSLITGFFSNTASEKSGLTKDSIKEVVQEVVTRVVRDQAGKQTSLFRSEECKTLVGNIHDISDTFKDWKNSNLKSPAEIKEGMEALKGVVGLGGSVDLAIRSIKAYYRKIEADIADTSSGLVHKELRKRMCFDTCALMTVPLNSWVRNPSSPDVQELNKPEWVPCPGQAEPDVKMNDANYKLCISHPHSVFMPCKFNEGCVARVDRRFGEDGCHQNYKTSLDDFKTIAMLLGCASEAVTLLHRVLFDLEVLGKVYNNFPDYDGDYSLRMRQWYKEFERVKYLQYIRNPALAKVFTRDGVDYNCDDYNSWLHLFSYRDGVLQKAPCSSSWWKAGMDSSNSAYTRATLACSVVNPNNEDPNWTEIGPTFSYEKILKQEWSDKFSVLS